MLGFIKKNAKNGRFVEIIPSDGITGKDVANKVIDFIKSAEFKEPYPEFTVSKKDLEAARISEYHLVAFLGYLNKDNKDVSYKTEHPKKKDGFMDHEIINFVWERKLFEYPEQEPVKVIVVKK